MNLLDVVNKNYTNDGSLIPDFRTGDTVAVHAKITEGEKTRIQIFQGVCISIKKEKDLNGHFRIRKMSSGIGVERVFPFHSPNIAKVEIMQRGSPVARICCRFKRCSAMPMLPPRKSTPMCSMNA